MARGPYFTYRPGGFGDRFFAGDPFVTLQRELNRVFEDLDLPTRQAAAQAAGSAPNSVSLDVSESENAFTVHADLPGVRPEDVDLQLNEDALTIRAERQSVQRGERENVHFAERVSGVFQRTVRLPSPVDAEAVQARFEHGVLTVTLPKVRAAERSRKIPIQGSGGASGSSSGPTSSGGSGKPDLGAAVVQSYTQGDGAQGASPAAGTPEPTDKDNPTTPGGAVHGYNE